MNEISQFNFITNITGAYFLICIKTFLRRYMFYARPENSYIDDTFSDDKLKHVLEGKVDLELT